MKTSGLASQDTGWASRAVWLAPCLISYLLLTWKFNFLTDDAFISFRYSRNLAEGLGLRYNVGVEPPVEGFSNFLWIIWLALFEWVRLDVTFWSRITSVVCGALLVWRLFEFARLRIGGGPLPAITAGLFLGTLPPMAAWSTSGLETMPFALLIFLAFESLLGDCERPRVARAAGALAAIVLIRTDGPYWVALIVSASLLSSLWLRSRGLSRATAIACSFAIAVFCGYLIFRYAYFGDLVSNTARAKVAFSTLRFQRGLNYDLIFMLTYLSVPLTILLSVPLLWGPRALRCIQAAVIIVGALLYGILVGGDFFCMGRFLIPALPFLALLFALVVERWEQKWSGRRGPVALLLATAITLSLLPGYDVHLVPEALRERFHFRWRVQEHRSEHQQWEFQRQNTRRWTELGRALARHSEPGESLVCGAIGAVGYYSGLVIYDRKGIVNREVALEIEGDARQSAGHEKHAPISFFEDKRPTYIAAEIVPASSATPARSRKRFRQLLQVHPEDEALKGAFEPEVLELTSTTDAGEERVLWRVRRRGTATGADHLTLPSDIVRPNLILIVWDTVRADRMSLYGYPKRTTPRLDESAREAVVFERAISPGNWTVPSHASIFTGLPVSAHGAVAPGKWLTDEHETLAETLAAAGYDTYAFTANPHASEVTNLVQGFQTVEHSWDGYWAPACRANTASKLIPEDRSTEFSPARAPDDDASVGKRRLYKDCGDHMGSALLRWIDSRPDKNKPFFAFLNYMEAHVPRWPRLSSRERITAPDQIRASLDMDASSFRQFLHMFGIERYAPRELRAIGDVFDATLLDLDIATKTLFDLLAERGLLDSSVVILTSDHGENLGEHGQLDHKYNIYDTLIRVPLLVRYPHGRHAGRIEAPVSTRDIHATALALAGLDVPRAAGSATPLPPHVPDRPTRPAFSEMIAPVPAALDRVSEKFPDFDPTPWRRRMRSIERDAFKLIAISDGAVELFDLSEDPSEENDLSAANPARVAEMQQALGTWVTSFPHFDPTAHERLAGPDALSPAVREQLRVLGYSEDPEQDRDAR
jgi:arylsulfatase A-like enzyme